MTRALQSLGHAAALTLAHTLQVTMESQPGKLGVKLLIWLRTQLVQKPAQQQLRLKHR